MRPAKLPSIQSFFYLVEREVVVPNGLRYIGLSVQAEPRALLAESEKEPGGQLSQAGLPIGISLLHYFSPMSMPHNKRVWPWSQHIVINALRSAQVHDRPRVVMLHCGITPNTAMRAAAQDPH